MGVSDQKVANRYRRRYRALMKARQSLTYSFAVGKVPFKSPELERTDSERELMIERLANNAQNVTSVLRHPNAAHGAGQAAARHRSVMRQDYQRMHNAFSDVERLHDKLLQQPIQYYIQEQMEQ